MSFLIAGLHFAAKLLSDDGARADMLPCRLQSIGGGSAKGRPCPLYLTAMTSPERESGQLPLRGAK